MAKPAVDLLDVEVLASDTAEQIVRDAVRLLACADPAVIDKSQVRPLHGGLSNKLYMCSLL
jgi:hypothetical protein